jgi:hypothetical protein
MTQVNRRKSSFPYLIPVINAGENGKVMKHPIRKNTKISNHYRRPKDCRKCGKWIYWNNLDNICISCNIAGRHYNGFCLNCRLPYEGIDKLCIPCYLAKRKENIDLSKVRLYSF